MAWKKWLRWTALVLAALAVLLGAAVWFLLRQLDEHALVARAAEQVRALTGRELAVDGPVRLQLLPSIALLAEGIRFSNAPGASQPEMARVGRLELDMALRPLLERRVEIGRVRLSGVDLLLETDAEGQGNWHFARASADAAPRASEPLHIALNTVQVRDSVLRYRAGPSGPIETLSIKALTLRASPQPAQPEAYTIDADAVFRGQALRASGRIDGLQTESALTFDLAASLAGARATLRGELPPAPDKPMPFTGRVEQADALAQMLGLTPPIALPLPIDTSGALRLEAGLLAIDDLKLAAQGQSATGRIVWQHAATTPSLSLTLAAPRLDIPRLLGPPPANARTAGTAGGRVFSQAPFPAVRLPPLKTEVDLRIGELVLPPSTTLGAVQGRFTTQGEKLELPSLAFDFARGHFTLSGSAQFPEGAPPRANTRVQARGVVMETLLAQLLRRNSPITGGPTDIDATLAASGRSMHAMAQSLSGEFRLRMGAAAVRGKALTGADELIAAVLRAFLPLGQSGDTTQIRCAAARLPLRGGVATADRSIAVDTPKLSLVMSGRIDLGAERLDLAMVPTVKRGTGLNPASLADMVRIGGPLTKPTVQIDPAGTARKAIEIGAAVASSGTTVLLQRLIGRTADADPCATALGERPAASAEPKKTEKPSPLKIIPRVIEGLLPR